MDAHRGLFHSQGSAAIFSECKFCPGHLSWPGRAPELGHQFMDLCKAGCPDGMAARFQTAAGIHGLLAAISSPLFLIRPPSPRRQNPSDSH